MMNRLLIEMNEMKGQIGNDNHNHNYNIEVPITKTYLRVASEDAVVIKPRNTQKKQYNEKGTITKIEAV